MLQVNSCYKDVSNILLENKTTTLMKLFFFFLRLHANALVLATKQTAAPKFAVIIVHQAVLLFAFIIGALVCSLSTNIHLSVVVGTLPFASRFPPPTSTSSWCQSLTTLHVGHCSACYRPNTSANNQSLWEH